MHLSLPSAGSLSNLASQAITGFASRAATAAKNFESDLQSGNIAGAQSFLSALEQKLSPGNTGSSLSSQFSQVSSDLAAGNLSGAQSDFSQLEQMISGVKPGTVSLLSSSSASAAGGSSPTNPQSTLADSGYLLQQNAYNSALNLSLPMNVPTFSANW
ncbi:MAG TPA: hypothetical protein VME68_16705 [Acidobacteriaceae bacterium]|nr:hypothetical protein [Acidobacteriaceae bacterium]